VSDLRIVKRTRDTDIPLAFRVEDLRQSLVYGEWPCGLHARTWRIRDVWSRTSDVGKAPETGRAGSTICEARALGQTEWPTT